MKCLKKINNLAINKNLNKMKIKLYLTKILPAFIVLFYISIVGILAQSKAHDHSRFAIIDPTYNSNVKIPKSNLNEIASSWIYGASELECWRLQLLQQRKDSAGLNVGYPGVFHQPFTKGSFRLNLKEPQKTKCHYF